MVGFWDSIGHFFALRSHAMEAFGWNILKVIIMVIVAKILIKIINRMVMRVLGIHSKMGPRRRKALESLVHNLIRGTLYCIVLLTALPLFGLHIGALLAGAGVAGIAIAFGAQSLLKDFFNGFFFLLEDQYGIGDYVVINNVYGQVKTFTLRLTALQVWTGEVVTIPNGQITQVTNYSKENSIAVVEVNVGYNTPTEQAIALIEDVMRGLKEENENIVGDVSMLGVQALNDSNYTIRATAECNPYTHWGVIREAKLRIHKVFRENGIDLPVQRIMYTQPPGTGQTK